MATGEGLLFVGRLEERESEERERFNMPRGYREPNPDYLNMFVGGAIRNREA